MEVYLIRHGIAAERGSYNNDNERPLTNEGMEKTQKVAQKLAKVDLSFDLILTSPLIRAYQTAVILKKCGLSHQVSEFEFLAPGGDLQAWISWCDANNYNHSKVKLALVGHEPDLGNWAELLVWGDIQGSLVVKKAGIIGLNLPDGNNPIGNSELFLLTSPKWLI